MSVSNRWAFMNILNWKYGKHIWTKALNKFHLNQVSQYLYWIVIYDWGPASEFEDYDSHNVTFYPSGKTLKHRSNSKKNEPMNWRPKRRETIYHLRPSKNFGEDHKLENVKTYTSAKKKIQNVKLIKCFACLVPNPSVKCTPWLSLCPRVLVWDESNLHWTFLEHCMGLRMTTAHVRNQR